MEKQWRFMAEVETPAGVRGCVRHGEKILTLGSCFANETGARMVRDGFEVTVNPFGQLYNPLSILAALRFGAENLAVTESELIENQGLWHSMLFHTRFSGADPAETARRMTGSINALNALLPRLTMVILTLGSARCFVLRESGNVVANCHKLHPDNFIVRDIDTAEVTRALTDAYNLLSDYNPDVRLIITVSPIRHKAYGYHSDKLSKATLLLGADNAISSINSMRPGSAVYFPAYEIMNDELRDYRFYASDMTHPSDVAAEYIYSRFADTFYSNETQERARREAKEAARRAHRQIHINQ